MSAKKVFSHGSRWMKGLPGIAFLSTMELFNFGLQNFDLGHKLSKQLGILGRTNYTREYISCKYYRNIQFYTQGFVHQHINMWEEQKDVENSLKTKCLTWIHKKNHNIKKILFIWLYISMSCFFHVKYRNIIMEYITREYLTYSIIHDPSWLNEKKNYHLLTRRV